MTPGANGIGGAAVSIRRTFFTGRKSPVHAEIIPVCSHADLGPDGRRDRRSIFRFC